MTHYVLHLYIAGNTLRAQRAAAELRDMCESELPGQCEIEIVDVLEKPEVAETEKVLATPTVVRSLPLPQRRVIGDLSDRQKVMFGLDLQGTLAP